MKVVGLEIFRCDAGWRNYHFLKLTTDDGIEAAALLPDQVYYSQPVGIGRRQRCHGRRRPPASWDTEHVGSANRDGCE